jgi:hypothetical protein
MRKCNFKESMRWCLGLRPTSKWAEPYESRGHGLALIASRHTAMGQCALGWRVVPHHGLSLRPWAGYKVGLAPEKWADEDGSKWSHAEISCRLHGVLNKIFTGQKCHLVG